MALNHSLMLKVSNRACSEEIGSEDAFLSYYKYLDCSFVIQFGAIVLATIISYLRDRIFLG